MTLQDIKDQVAKEMGFNLNTNVHSIHFSDYTNEIAKRYATECCKATLEKAADKAKLSDNLDPVKDAGAARMALALVRQKVLFIDKESITSPENIVLL
jgi:hypothetical protein